MAKLKKIYKADFTVVSTALYRDRNLNLKDRGLLGTMLSLPEDWDFSIKGLRAIVDDGEKTIRNSLQRLEELGYLVRRRVYKNGKVCDWDYIFSDHPLTDEELGEGGTKSVHLDVQKGQVDADLYVQKVHVEKVQVPNDTQLNIQEENKKEENDIYTDSLKEMKNFRGEVYKIFDREENKLSKRERGIITGWFENGVDISLIKQAHDEAWQTFDKGKMNFNYVRGIVKNWLAAGKDRAEEEGNFSFDDEEDVMLRDRAKIPVYED